MNIKPIFKKASGASVNALTVGLPADQNGSMLSGSTQYAYTPVMFQLTKDYADNIYVKIYKINQGSLDLPRLYYEVQSNDDPSIPGDWTVKKVLDDTYFAGDFAVTVITGVNPNNEMHYKVVVKSDGVSDRIESPKMPYILSEDTGKPPLPTGIEIIGKTLRAGVAERPATGERVAVKTTDITISWDKPRDWDNAKNDLCFHFILCTNQTSLSKNVDLYMDGLHWGSYPVRYRLVKYMDALSDKIHEEGNRLWCVIEGFDLFTGESPAGNVEEIANPDGYPEFLFPNTVYYLQMYTTKAADAGSADPEKMSNLSLVKSFTTLAGAQHDVPLPSGFRLDKNNTVTVPGTPPMIINNVELMFDKVRGLDWENYTSDGGASKKIYYDLYMSGRTAADSFILIGTTQEPDGDVAFTGADDELSTSIKATVREFSPGTEARAAFGERLRPNSVYYFIAKTRLVISNPPAPDIVKESAATSILAVTTARHGINPPDNSEMAPLAPDDFSIALDSGGNMLVTGSSAAFNWTRRETGAVYELICTSERVLPDANRSIYEHDALFTSFINEFDGIDGLLDGKVILNPGASRLPEGLSYDAATGLCLFSINSWLFPNRLYYFSLKAVNPANGRESLWISIPVTTSLIEGPKSLEAVRDFQLAFFWTDNAPNVNADDCRIFIKGPKDNDYRLVSRAGSTVVKDMDGITYYGRISGLEPDTVYSVRVYRGGGNGTLVFQKNNMRTRNPRHEIDIMWFAPPADAYARYETAIKTADDPEYLILRDIDFEQYINKDGRILPYYMEETPKTVNDRHLVLYRARIKKAKTMLPGGFTIYRPLKPNTRYYIKVRAVRADPADAALASYSKFAGPVDIRTDFSQQDYDAKDQEEKSRVVFLDKIDKLEREFFFRVETGDSSANGILLKGERVVNAMRNNGSYPFIIDISAVETGIDADIVYLPESVVKAVNSENKPLVLRTAGAEFMLRPGTLDFESNLRVSSLKKRAGINGLIFEIKIERAAKPPVPVPSGKEAVSLVNGVNIRALGVLKTEGELAGMMRDKLYNANTGLVGEKLNMLLNSVYGISMEDAPVINEYINQLIKLIERELSVYAHLTIEAAKASGAEEAVEDFGTPMGAKLFVSGGKGVKLPYVLYGGSKAWKELSSGVERPGSLSFDAAKTGKYAVLLARGPKADMPADSGQREEVGEFLARYDLSGIFQGISVTLAPQDRVSSREIILLFEKVMGKTGGSEGLDLGQKAKKLGLADIINPNVALKDVERQEAAAVAARVYSAKAGVDAENFRTTRKIWIKDEEKIGGKYYKYVEMVIDLEIMALDENLNFNPKGFVTRAELIRALAAALRQAGEM